MPAGAPSRKISDIKMPVKSDGKADKRYKMPQVVKSDGTRDQRTKLMSKRQRARAQHNNRKAQKQTTKRYGIKHTFFTFFPLVQKSYEST